MQCIIKNTNGNIKKNNGIVEVFNLIEPFSFHNSLIFSNKDKEVEFQLIAFEPQSAVEKLFVKEFFDNYPELEWKHNKKSENEP